ncbi:MAG: ABC transporter ATP-binding protein [Armatimonadetes bacterium]|nr:ABC transporter ATP-binding protein [Armatimonadota bacterium]
MDTKNIPKNKRAVFRRLVNYLRPHKGDVAIGIISNIALAVVGLGPPLLFGAITDQVVPNGKFDMPTHDRINFLKLYAFGLVVLFLMQTIMSWMRAFVMHILGEKIILHLRKDIYARLQTLSVSYFDSRQTGEIMSRVSSDTQVVEEFVNHAADTVISDVLKLIAMISIMFWLSPALMIVALIPVPIMFFLAYRFARKIRSIHRAVREKLGDINADIQEKISGMRIVKAFAREEYEYDNFVANAENYFQERVRVVTIWTRFFPSVELLVRLGQVAIWVTGPILILKDQATMGTLVIFTSYLGMLYEPVGNLARINDTIQRSLAAAERIFEVIDEEPLIRDDEQAIELPKVQGRVDFESVTFKYDDGEEVLKEISIHAEPGQIVALVGRSGAGKTSIVNLIPRFYDPNEGRVLIDGFDIKRVTQKSLRSQIAMVLQDTFLFNGTVRDNIKYGKLDATDEEIIEAANTANAHEFIESCPKGYDTEIGERGIKLSGGQKQRIAIARAVLADPRILILDEATSSVDSESEFLIHRAMDRLMEGRTTFVIAHRLSTIKHANQIITLADGRVTEVGDHKSLLDQDGVYSQMYSMQFRLDEEMG